MSASSGSAGAVDGRGGVAREPSARLDAPLLVAEVVAQAVQRDVADPPRRVLVAGDAPPPGVGARERVLDRVGGGFAVSAGHRE